MSSLRDPFAALDVGQFGTDVAVYRDDIAERFGNDDLHLVRVYVDENRDLRRVDDDSFVRNVVYRDAEDDHELIRAMLGDVPPAVPDDEQMVSALLSEHVPPSLVRLDDPDGENVVTKVMGLDAETNKYELLVSLGSVASRPEFSDEDLATMERALDTLASMDDDAAVDAYIEEHLL